MLYKRQLGRTQLTFIENALFEAVFGDSVDNEIEIPFEIVEAQRVERAVKVLEKLVKGKVSLQVSDFKVSVRK